MIIKISKTTYANLRSIESFSWDFAGCIPVLCAYEQDTGRVRDTYKVEGKKLTDKEFDGFLSTFEMALMQNRPFFDAPLTLTKSVVKGISKVQRPCKTCGNELSLFKVDQDSNFYQCREGFCPDESILDEERC